MSAIEKRLAALAAEVQRRREIAEGPVDPLSRSILEFADEMSAQDDVGKAQLLEALNNPDDGESDGLSLTMQDVERIIDDWRPR